MNEMTFHKVTGMIANPPMNPLEAAALKAATPIVRALAECDDELRAEAFELFKQLEQNDLDPEQQTATLALLAEILFPNGDASGLPGLDLEEAERIAPSQNPDAPGVLAAIDRDEATFAGRVRELMAARGLTQAELADKVGIGQPAVSMMLNRPCRPQRKTVARFAEALGVGPADLWPSFKK
jgi:lambda repressor-like predicted transcriptional regulator